VTDIPAPYDIAPAAIGDADPTSPGDQELTDALVQTSFAVLEVLTRVAADHDLSLTQVRVLGILRDHRPRMTELARFLGLDKSTMSGLVERAERRGLLERTRSATDGRVMEVGMTAVGAALAERVQSRVRSELGPLIADMDDRTRSALVRGAAAPRDRTA
jgi:DNA-binding MarR family transcriptional regulator